MVKRLLDGGGPPPAVDASDSAASTGAAKTKKVSTSKSSKAGLKFPISRINRRMLELHKTTKRVGVGSAIYVTATVEYFCAELLEMAIRQTKSDGKGRTRITAADVLKGLRLDPDLHKATSGLRVMVGDKQKGVANLIICKSDLDKKHLAKMNAEEWFGVDDGFTVDLNWKRYCAEALARETSEEEKS